MEIARLFVIKDLFPKGIEPPQNGKVVQLLRLSGTVDASELRQNAWGKEQTLFRGKLKATRLDTGEERLAYSTYLPFAAERFLTKAFREMPKGFRFQLQVTAVASENNPTGYRYGLANAVVSDLPDDYEPKRPPPQPPKSHSAAGVKASMAYQAPNPPAMAEASDWETDDIPF
jgi:hypothetical protein